MPIISAAFSAREHLAQTLRAMFGPCPWRPALAAACLAFLPGVWHPEALAEPLPAADATSIPRSEAAVGVAEVDDVDDVVNGVAVPSAPATLATLARRIGETRKAEGLQALMADPRLDRAARHHAEDLARRQSLDHQGSDGTDLAARLIRAGYPYARAGENLAMGSGDPDTILALWLDSPGHRRNLLDAHFTEIGLARAGDADHRAIWVLVLARPWIPPPPRTTPP